MDTISFDDFLKVEIRVGKIVEAIEFVGARKPAYILHVDFGEQLGIKSRVLRSPRSTSRRTF